MFWNLSNFSMRNCMYFGSIFLIFFVILCIFTLLLRLSRITRFLRIFFGFKNCSCRFFMTNIVPVWICILLLILSDLVIVWENDLREIFGLSDNLVPLVHKSLNNLFLALLDTNYLIRDVCADPYRPHTVLFSVELKGSRELANHVQLKSEMIWTILSANP